MTDASRIDSSTKANVDRTNVGGRQPSATPNSRVGRLRIELKPIYAKQIAKQICKTQNYPTKTSMLPLRVHTKAK